MYTAGEISVDIYPIMKVHFVWYILSGTFCLVHFVLVHFVWYILSGTFCLWYILSLVHFVWYILSGTFCLGTFCLVYFVLYILSCFIFFCSSLVFYNQLLKLL